jgi:hypothetical protein
MSRAIQIDSSAGTSARLERRDALRGADIGEMYALLSRHFNGVTEERFGKDLLAKNWVLLIERDGRLVGFTTILAYETRFEEETVSVIYSGDTIVAPGAWNTPTLPRAWIESVVTLRSIYPLGRFVWLLITSGFRTYRFLPVFWREFYPRYDAATPARWGRLIGHLASERFADQYNSLTGVVRFRSPQQLRGPLALIPGGRIADPHVEFFASRNPGHSNGDELVCVTELTPANLTAAGRRMTRAVPQW